MSKKKSIINSDKNMILYSSKSIQRTRSPEKKYNKFKHKIMI